MYFVSAYRHKENFHNSTMEQASNTVVKFVRFTREIMGSNPLRHGFLLNFQLGNVMWPHKQIEKHTINWINIREKNKALNGSMVSEMVLISKLIGSIPGLHKFFFSFLIFLFGPYARLDIHTCESMTKIR